MTQLFKFLSRAFKLVFPGIAQDAGMATSRLRPGAPCSRDNRDKPINRQGESDMATPTRSAVRAALLGAGLLLATQAMAQQQKITVAWPPA
ncbi:hypothetical protein G6F65_022917 [Rhizopus arrhizus]|nr:hypothetical protein G6F65_022917 [Rhizopus arrhizus]